MPTYSVKVGPGGAITLPSDICEALNIKEGGEVEFFLTVDGFVHFHALTGDLADFGVEKRTPPISIREMDDAICDAVVERNLRSLSPRSRRSAAE